MKYIQNKQIWMKAAMGIMTTDSVPKISNGRVQNWKFKY